MNITKLPEDRIKDLIYRSISHTVSTEMDTTEDVDMLLTELIALRKLAEDMADALCIAKMYVDDEVKRHGGIEECDIDYRTDAESCHNSLDAYRVEYPKKEEE